MRSFLIDLRRLIHADVTDMGQSAQYNGGDPDRFPRLKTRNQEPGFALEGELRMDLLSAGEERYKRGGGLSFVVGLHQVYPRGAGRVLTDNGTEWVNADFWGLLAELNITRELTAVDGPKSNGRVERRIALVMEGGKAAFLEFPNLFPGVTFPAKALSFRAIWPEAFAWMNDSLNIAVEASKEDKRCTEVKLYGRRRIRVLLPFMMPDFHHRHRPSNMHSKGERCFYLNSGQDHSSTTHKIITPAGVPTTYSEHCTFYFGSQGFRGNGRSWESVGGGGRRPRSGGRSGGIGGSSSGDGGDLWWQCSSRGGGVGNGKGGHRGFVFVVENRQ